MSINTNYDVNQNKNEVYSYYSKKALEIAESKGIKEALEYVNGTMRKNTKYGLTHMIMHVVGHEAYHKTASLKKAMSYLPECTFTEECFWDYDGYQHGVFQSYFSHNRNVGNASILMRQACDQYFDNALLTSDNISKRLISTQCFHALGHALMNFNDNDVFKSLSDCETLPENTMRDRCYYGVFMENSYLQIPFYEPNAPRPFGKNETIMALCGKVKEEQKFTCSNFVAWTMLLEEKNIDSSLSSCFSLEEKYHKPCIYLAAKHFIPNILKNDFHQMAIICKNLGYYEETCIAAVAAGIRQGGSGPEYKNFPFCEAINQSFKKSCLSSV